MLFCFLRAHVTQKASYFSSLIAPAVGVNRFSSINVHWKRLPISRCPCPSTPCLFCRSNYTKKRLPSCTIAGGQLSVQKDLRKPPIIIPLPSVICTRYEATLESALQGARLGRVLREIGGWKCSMYPLSTAPMLSRKDRVQYSFAPVPSQEMPERRDLGTAAPDFSSVFTPKAFSIIWYVQNEAEVYNLLFPYLN